LYNPIHEVAGMNKGVEPKNHDGVSRSVNLQSKATKYDTMKRVTINCGRDSPFIFYKAGVIQMARTLFGLIFTELGNLIIVPKGLNRNNQKVRNVVLGAGSFVA
jgi:hypothetical protein